MESPEAAKDQGDLVLPASRGDALQLNTSPAEDLKHADAEHYERLLADQALRDGMAADGFVGARYEMWRELMAGYAIAVLHAQILTGTIYGYAADKGRPPKGATLAVRRLLREDQQARGDLVTLLVAMTFKSFRSNALLTGKWQASGGAGLHTYFIGAAHLMFSTALREWLTTLPAMQEQSWDPDRFPENPSSPLTPPWGATPRRHERPDQVVIDDADMACLLDLAPTSAKDIINYYEQGYDQEEIAQLTGRPSRRAVEGVIHRYRKELERRGYS